MTPHGQLPPSLLKSLGAERLTPLPVGGSNATNFLVNCVDRTVFAKMVPRAGDATCVDGHTTADLHRKWSQMMLIERADERVRSRYARPVTIVDTPEACVMVTEACVGSPLIDVVDSAHGQAGLAAVLNHLMDPSLTHWRIPGCHAFFDEYHTQRVRRRIDFIRNHRLGAELTSARRHEGWEVPAVEEALEVLDDAEIIRRLSPTMLHFPLHGDLNLQNVLVDEHAVKLIDVRGVVRPWDVVYDLGKMVFDVLIFNSLARLRIPTPAAVRIRQFRRVLDTLQGSDLGRWLERHDGDWQVRLHATVIIHVLCEAAARVSIATTSRSADRPMQMNAALDLWCRGLRAMYELRSSGPAEVAALPKYLGISDTLGVE